tara:strand:- start:937 stop:1308 length:372 start_codon:yes stop_codon:yes gene_type:complete
MKSEIDKKREIIFKNNEFICDYTNIIHILEQNNCKYTENTNGIFLNLTVVPDDIIEQIYPFFINNILNIYGDTNRGNYKKSDMDNISEPIYVSKIIKQTYTIPIETFSEEDKKILRYSSNYFL